MSSVRVLLVGAALSACLASAAAAEDLVFTLINKSSSALAEFYASPTGVDDWEEDILGVDVLDANSRVRITIADGRSQCRYDLKFVFDDGDELVKNKVDLCNTRSYTLSDN